MVCYHSFKLPLVLSNSVFFSKSIVRFLYTCCVISNKFKSPTMHDSEADNEMCNADEWSAAEWQAAAEAGICHSHEILRNSLCLGIRMEFILRSQFRFLMDSFGQAELPADAELE